MKREFITGLLPDISKDILDQIMSENGKDVEAQKARTTTVETNLATANQTITDLQTAVKKFDGVDVGKLQGDLTALQSKYDTDTAQIRMESALNLALTASKAKNVKPVKALLDASKIKLDGDKLLGLDDQLEALKKSDAYLFDVEETPPEDNPLGTVRLASGGTHKPLNNPEYDKMSDADYYATVMKKKE